MEIADSIDTFVVKEILTVVLAIKLTPLKRWRYCFCVRPYSFNSGVTLAWPPKYELN